MYDCHICEEVLRRRMQLVLEVFAFQSWKMENLGYLSHKVRSVLKTGVQFSGSVLA